VLQCAVCCSVLQRVTLVRKFSAVGVPWGLLWIAKRYRVLQCVAVCVAVCVALCCRELQCVAVFFSVCCIVLQCVAVCYFGS